MSIELNEMTENVGVCDLNVKLNIKLCKNYELVMSMVLPIQIQINAYKV